MTGFVAYEASLFWTLASSVTCATTLAAFDVGRTVPIALHIIATCQIMLLVACWLVVGLLYSCTNDLRLAG
jgi:hypothetical protein